MFLEYQSSSSDSGDSREITHSKYPIDQFQMSWTQRLNKQHANRCLILSEMDLAALTNIFSPPFHVKWVIETGDNYKISK